MHHSEKPIPGTYAAALVLVFAAAAMASLLIGSVVGAAQGINWLWRLV